MNAPRRLLAVVVATAVLAVPALGTAALADSTSIDFENYSAGSINGQHGWQITGPYDVQVAAHAAGVPAGFGTNSLRISNAVTSGSFGDQLFSPSLANEAGEATAENGGMSGGVRQPMFTSQFTVASASGALQPGLGASVALDRGDGARMSSIRLEHTVDGLHITVSDADKSTATPPCTGCVSFPIHDLGTYDPTVPHVVRSEARFNPGPSNDVVRVFVDGVLKATVGSWEDYYRFDQESGTSGNSRTVDSLLFRQAGTPHPELAGQGFLFDNVSYASGPQAPYIATTLKENPVLLSINPFYLNLTLSLSATLTAMGQPLPGKTVVFTVGAKTICSGTTNAAGLARCGGITSLTDINIVIARAVKATFAGDATTYLGSTDYAGLIG
jgi:hypothetical protein